MTTTPHTIFIVPYRDRAAHKKQFDDFFKQLKEVKQWTETDVRLVYSHQCDTRMFNRGAVKNIGFMAMQQEYPNAWRDITFVFHDVDSIPVTPDLFKYETNKGVVSHYYGVTFALGGMFAIKGSDFADTGGFPNFWGWGLEDNIIQQRVISKGLSIDRTEFVPITDKRVLRPFDGLIRINSNRETSIYLNKEYIEDLSDLKNVNFNCINEYVNITSFETNRSPDTREMSSIDIRKPYANRIILRRGYFRKNWGLQL